MTDWDAWLAQHHPELKVPERSVVAIFGPAPWVPSREAAPKTAPACPNCKNRVRRGSRLYCPACHRSGYDAALAEQRRLAGVPKAEPKVAEPKVAAKAPKTRRQRRAERFAEPLTAKG